MICIYCSNNKTKVTNSRLSKKESKVWRRRMCLKCDKVFSTYEIPEYSYRVRNGKNITQYSESKLHLSIAKSFEHNKKSQEYDTLYLTHTVTSKIFTSSETIAAARIADTAYVVLSHFDKIAALQYAARHDMLDSKGRKVYI